MTQTMWNAHNSPKKKWNHMTFVSVGKCGGSCAKWNK